MVKRFTKKYGNKGRAFNYLQTVLNLYSVSIPKSLCGDYSPGLSEWIPSRSHTIKNIACNARQIWFLRLSHLDHLIWRKATPYFWCVFYTKLGVLSHKLSVLSH